MTRILPRSLSVPTSVEQQPAAPSINSESTTLNIPALFAERTTLIAASPLNRANVEPQPSTSIQELALETLGISAQEDSPSPPEFSAHLILSLLKNKDVTSLEQSLQALPQPQKTAVFALLSQNPELRQELKVWISKSALSPEILAALLKQCPKKCKGAFLRGISENTGLLHCLLINPHLNTTLLEVFLANTTENAEDTFLYQNWNDGLVNPLHFLLRRVKNCGPFIRVLVEKCPLKLLPDFYNNHYQRKGNDSFINLLTHNYLDAPTLQFLLKNLPSNCRQDFYKPKSPQSNPLLKLFQCPMVSIEHLLILLSSCSPEESKQLLAKTFSQSNSKVCFFGIMASSNISLNLIEFAFAHSLEATIAEAYGWTSPSLWHTLLANPDATIEMMAVVIKKCPERMFNNLFRVHSDSTALNYWWENCPAISEKKFSQLLALCPPERLGKWILSSLKPNQVIRLTTETKRVILNVFENGVLLNLDPTVRKKILLAAYIAFNEMPLATEKLKELLAAISDEDELLSLFAELWCIDIFVEFFAGNGKQSVLDYVENKGGFAQLSLKERLAILPILTPQQVNLTLQGQNEVPLALVNGYKIASENHLQTLREFCDKSLLSVQNGTTENFKRGIRAFMSHIPPYLVACAALDKDLLPWVLTFITTFAEPQIAAVIPQLTSEHFITAMQSLTDHTTKAHFLRGATTEQRKAFLKAETLLPDILEKWEEVQAHFKAITDCSKEELKAQRTLLQPYQQCFYAWPVTEQKLQIVKNAIQHDLKEDDPLMLEVEEVYAQMLAKFNAIRLPALQRIRTIEAALATEITPPDNYLDQVTSALMEHPVRLRGTDGVIDRSTVESFRGVNPFNRAKFVDSDIIPDIELEKAIKNWRTANYPPIAENNLRMCTIL